MRPSCLSIPLLAAASLLAQTSRAQYAPVDLLAPAKVGVRPVAPAEALGQPVPPKAPSIASQATSAPVANQARPVIPQPLYLINSSIIVGVSGLNKIRPQDIANVVVYKGEDIPLAWRTATAGGVVDLTLKPGVKIRSVALAKLKHRQHLTGPVRFALDGRPLADTSLRIAAAAIKQLEVTAATGNEIANVLNIKIMTEKPSPKKYPPGTIFIRGVAGR